MTKSFQKFRKRATQFAVAVTLAGASVVGANAASTTQGIANHAVNLREKATVKSDKITTIKSQQSMVIEGSKGNFYKVTYGDQEGYVSKKYVNKYDAEDTQTTIKTTASLNVRTMPTTNSPSQKLGKLVKGQVVTVKGTIKGAKSTYYVIDYAGQTAYVSANAKYSAVAAADAKNEDVKGTAKVTNVKSAVNIRKGPGTEFDKIGSAPKDVSLDVLDSVQDGWVKVRYQNANGYVSAKCLSDITVGNQAPVIDVNDKQYVVLNSTFTNDTLGAKVSDAEDTNVKVEYSGTVDTTKEGTYTVTITATDSQGAKTTKTVTVVVRENQGPSLYCDYTEQSPLKVVAGTTFTNSMLKATATDREDGDLTSKITYSGTIDTTANKVDKEAQKVTMTVKDANGKSVELKAYVVIVNASEPTFTYYNKAEGHERREVLTDTTITVTKGNTITKDSLIKMLKLRAYNTNLGYVAQVGADLEKLEDAGTEIAADGITVTGLDKVDVNTNGSYGVTLKISNGLYTKTINLGINVKSSGIADEIYYDNNAATADPEITFDNKDVKKGIDDKHYTLNVKKGTTFTNDLLKATAKDAMADTLSISYSDISLDTNKTGDKATIKLTAKDKVGREATVYVALTVVNGTSSDDYTIYTAAAAGKNPETVVNGYVIKADVGQNPATMTTNALLDAIAGQIKVTATDANGNEVIPVVTVEDVNTGKYDETQTATLVIKLTSSTGNVTTIKKAITLTIYQENYTKLTYTKPSAIAVTASDVSGAESDDAAKTVIENAVKTSFATTPVKNGKGVDVAVTKVEITSAVTTADAGQKTYNIKITTADGTVTGAVDVNIA